MPLHLESITNKESSGIFAWILQNQLNECEDAFATKDKLCAHCSKDIVDKVTDQISQGIVFVANVVNNEKIVFIAKNKGTKFACGNLVKEAAIICGGNGGGRPDFAQAGGKDVTKVDDALNKIKEIILG